MQIAFGQAASLMFLGQGLLSVFFLAVVNYVEHYGLQRSILPNGKPERVAAEHSWNANHLLSNAVLLRLQRHTDHHMNASKPYHELESIEGAPKLPASYSAMMLLAFVPPMWFCVMNPRVHLHRLIADIQRQAKPGAIASGK
jgi:alkane 1-monooxygenase